MANGSYGKCAGCGAMVIWVKTQAGKVVTGVTGVDAQSADGFGYISHFATCKSANNFRRGRK